MLTGAEICNLFFQPGSSCITQKFDSSLAIMCPDLVGKSISLFITRNTQLSCPSHQTHGPVNRPCLCRVWWQLHIVERTSQVSALKMEIILRRGSDIFNRRLFSAQSHFHDWLVRWHYYIRNRKRPSSFCLFCFGEYNRICLFKDWPGKYIFNGNQSHFMFLKDLYIHIVWSCQISHQPSVWFVLA